MKEIKAYQFQNLIGEDKRPKWIIVAVQMGLITFVPKGQAPPILIVNSNGQYQIAKIDDWIVKDNGVLKVIENKDFQQNNYSNEN